jgi:hypothetical protein
MLEEAYHTYVLHDSFLRVHYVAILEHVLREVDANGFFGLDLLYRSLELGAHGYSIFDGNCSGQYRG